MLSEGFCVFCSRKLYSPSKHTAKTDQFAGLEGKMKKIVPYVIILSFRQAYGVKRSVSMGLFL
jgi:hypothetical protein